MADPLAITSLLVQISALLKQLYDYGKEVKGARKDISALSSELNALKGVLQDCKDRHSQGSTPRDLANVISTAHDTLNGLAGLLAPLQSKARRIQQSLGWPLKDEQTRKILDKLERVKSLLLLDLMGDVHGAVQELNDMKHDVRSIAATVERESVRRIELELDESRRRLLHDIAPSSPESVHSQICSIPKAPSSGSWFLDDPFEIWLRNTHPGHQILGLVGMSGAGKTTLIAASIERLKDAGSSSPLSAYMYCIYNDSATRTNASIFGAWISQLWYTKPSVLEPLKTRRERNQEIKVTDLADALVDIANSVGTVLLIVDAVNESNNPSRLCADLLELVKRTASLRILVSSTSDLNLASAMYRRIDITPLAILTDVSAYIKQKRLQSQVLCRVPEEALLDAILPQINGMFRWACCQMDLICQHSTPRKVKEALKHLPGSLDDTYIALLQRVPVASRDLVRGALLWLSYSRRPLRLDEILDAVCIEEGDETIDDDSRVFPPTRLIDMCEGLVIWNAHTDIVALAHNSVRTFLESAAIAASPVAFFHLDASAAELTIIRKCLTYLLIDPFALGYCDSGRWYDLLQEYPLLGYAATMWAQHAQPYAKEDRLNPGEMQLIEELFRTYAQNANKSNFFLFVECLIPDCTRAIVEEATPLYYAASFGLKQVVASMLDSGQVDLKDASSPWYIDRKAGRGRSTSLQVACWRARNSIVPMLLKAGADPNSEADSGMTNLDAAANDKISDMLRTAGAVDDSFG